MVNIDAFLTPYFPETETQFDDSVVIMIDVLRASTTICAALNNGAKEVIASESLEKAVKIYSTLDKDMRFLGGERNCEKPTGFDAGNSPKEYTSESVEGRNVIITTTNGTKLFQKAKRAKVKIIGSFVNFNAVLNFIKGVVSVNQENDEVTNICILCAGTDGRMSYEDTLCAGAFIKEISDNYYSNSITDTAHAAKTLFEINKDYLNEFILKTQHSLKLIDLGLTEDIETALSFDKYDVLPVIHANSIKKFEIEG